MRLAPLLGFLALALPMAGAQPPPDPVVEFAGQDVPGFLRPDSDVATVPFTLRWSCSTEEISSSPVDAITGEFQTDEVPPGVTANVSPISFTEAPVSADRCTDDAIRHEASTALMIVASRSVPAFEDQTVRVHATITYPDSSGGPPKTYGPYAANTTFAADFLALSEIGPRLYVVRVANIEQVAVFPVEVTNFSNGPARMCLTATPERPGELSVNVPPCVLLDAAGGEGDTETVLVNATLERSSGSLQRFEATFNLTSQDPRGTTADVTHLQLVVELGRHRAPGPLAGTAIVAAAAAALLGFARRRA